MIHRLPYANLKLKVQGVRHGKLSALRHLLLLMLPLWGMKGAAQDVTLSSYGSQSSITTYNGSILLTNGFNTNGSSVHIFISQGNPPANGGVNVASNPSSAQNYIAAWTATAPVTDPNTLASKQLSDVKLTVQYFDGLGRPLQTVAKQGSLVTATGTTGDLVIPVVYDAFGREAVKYLPYVSTTSQDGSYKTDALSAQPAWYGGSSSPVAGQNELGSNAVDSILYEASPLNRVLKEMAPGGSWKGAGVGVQQGYWINTAKDSVRIWDIGYQSTLGSGFITPTSTSTYDAGTLYKNITTDEANHQVVEFKDKDGHIVLKKVQLTATADDGTGSGHTGWLCTYYVYDDLGNLRCVVQPDGVQTMNTAGSWVLSATILSEQCFRYEYDGRNRMIMKQVPGAGAVYMAYDTKDRLVMTQDANMRSASNWIVTRYDTLNRPDTTWLYNNATAFGTILTAAAAATTYPAVTPSASQLLTATHYDDYNSLPSGLAATYLTTWDSYLAAASTTAYPYPEKRPQATPSTAVTTKGLVTWTSAAVLDSTPVVMLPTVNIYDDKGRVIQTQAKNITGGIDVTTTQYTWAGQPLIVINKTEDARAAGAQTTVTVTRMTYDELGRLVRTEMRQSNTKVNSNAMSAYATLSEVQYDALGQVKYKKLGNQRTSATAYNTYNPLETQSYDYNIRGWLLGVNRAYARDLGTTDNTTSTGQVTQGGEQFTEGNDATVTYLNSNYFGFDLGYDKKNNTLINSQQYTNSQLTGNITGMVWKSAHDRKVRKYDFTYDYANRLTAANFGQYTGSSFTNATVNYGVGNLAYDNNGNILSMNQSGLKSSNTSAVIDQLTYSYNSGSNKLSGVADAITNTASENLGDFQDGHAGTDYAYDNNGNLTQDLNKNISSIAYNTLNLPRVITVTGKGAILYYYDAAGNKLMKKTVDNTAAKATLTTYLGSSVYQSTMPLQGTGVDTLQFFGTTEGRARINAAGNAFVYDYFLKDHLGNTRMVITDDYNVASPILEATSYYPFGVQMKGIGLEASGSLHNKKWTFQHQEYNDDLGVDIDEFKYRMDDPQIGRFWQIDPLADDYTYNSPYAFSEDKVTGLVELEGLEAVLPTPLGPIPLPFPIFFPGSAQKGGGNISIPTFKQGMQNAHNTFVSIGNGIASLVHDISDGISGTNTSYTPPFEYDFSPVDGPKILMSEGKTNEKGSESNPHETSRQARRGAMRKAGIPTSQPLHKDKESKSSDKVYLDRDGNFTVQDAKNDQSHQGSPHWEAGETKKDPSKSDGLNRGGSGRSRTNKPQMRQPKAKSYYKPSN